MSLLSLVALTLTAFASDPHEAKNVLVKAYDVEHHDLVLMIDGHEKHLHTEKAVLHGTPKAGGHVDVKWDGDHAKEITAH